MTLAAAVVLLAVVQTDSGPYADPATRELIDQARQRHAYQDRLVRDYTARIRTRIDAGFGRSRFARILPVMAHETAARVTWALPNDLRVDVLGERGRSVFDNAEVEAEYDRPWFVPRSLGDSIRLVDDELPATAALHPLAPGAETQYRYAIVDSVRLSLPGRTVNAIAVDVQPRSLGPALIAGRLWFDGETAEIVRMAFVFVGQYLWGTPDGATAEDSASARNDNTWATRIIKLEADLEYALFQGLYWMPYRQLLQLTVDIPWFLNVAVPIRFLTTFEEYEVNTSRGPQFDVAAAPDAGGDAVRSGRESVEVRNACPDGAARCDRHVAGYARVGRAERGGRWEVYYPPDSALERYAWPDRLTLALSGEDEQRIHATIATLGEIGERLPGQWVGRIGRGPAFENVSDLYRFNRVQGSTIGFGYQWRPGPAFTTVVGRAAIGLGDHRPTGTVTWRRDGPSGRLDITAFRAVRETEPWTGGLGFGNSMNALFTGHDDADYLLALGGGLAFQSYGRGLLREASVGVFFERQRTMGAFGRSDLADVFGSGQFELNPPVTEGDYLRFSVSRRSGIGPVTLGQGADLLVGVDRSRGAARFWGTADAPFVVAGRSGRFNARGGVSAGDDLDQMLYRIGGPETVRGYAYGALAGRAFWSAQLDVALRREEAWSPVVFVDVADAYRAPPGGLRRLDGVAPGEGPLVGVGAGLSLFKGFVRFNVAKGLNPDRALRFDLLFRAQR